MNEEPGCSCQGCVCECSWEPVHSNYECICSCLCTHTGPVSRNISNWLKIFWLKKYFNSHFILLYKAVSFFCLKLKISIATELNEFSFLGRLHIYYEMVLGYFIYGFKQLNGFRLFFSPLIPWYSEPLCARGVAACNNYIRQIIQLLHASLT